MDVAKPGQNNTTQVFVDDFKKLITYDKSIKN